MEYRRHVGTNDERVCLHVSIEMVLANKHAKTTTITMVVTFFFVYVLFVCCRLCSVCAQDHTPPSCTAGTFGAILCIHIDMYILYSYSIHTVEAHSTIIITCCVAGDRQAVCRWSVRHTRCRVLLYFTIELNLSTATAYSEQTTRPPDPIYSNIENCVRARNGKNEYNNNTASEQTFATNHTLIAIDDSAVFFWQTFFFSFFSSFLLPALHRCRRCLRVARVSDVAAVVVAAVVVAVRSSKWRGDGWWFFRLMADDWTNERMHRKTKMKKKNRMATRADSWQVTSWNHSFECIKCVRATRHNDTKSVWSMSDSDKRSDGWRQISVNTCVTYTIYSYSQSSNDCCGMSCIKPTRQMRKHFHCLTWLALIRHWANERARAYNRFLRVSTAIALIRRVYMYGCLCAHWLAFNIFDFIHFYSHLSFVVSVFPYLSAPPIKI